MLKMHQSKIFFSLSVLSVILVLALLPQAYGFTRVFSFDATVYSFKLDYDGSVIKFAAPKIFFDGFSWVNNTHIKFYSLKTVELDSIPNPFLISLIGPASATITKPFLEKRFEADVVTTPGASATLAFNTGDWGPPHRVEVNGQIHGDWRYEGGVVTVFNIVGSTVAVIWPTPEGGGGAVPTVAPPPVEERPQMPAVTVTAPPELMGVGLLVIVAVVVAAYALGEANKKPEARWRERAKNVKRSRRWKN